MSLTERPSQSPKEEDMAMTVAPFVEALDSAVTQTYTDFELVVEDDGSTDDCAPILC